jgi:hypothetical protein
LTFIVYFPLSLSRRRTNAEQHGSAAPVWLQGNRHLTAQEGIYAIFTWLITPSWVRTILQKFIATPAVSRFDGPWVRPHPLTVNTYWC